MAGTQSAIKHSVRRIMHLATMLKADSYLEIGVHKGGTFLGIDINRKVAVDPAFGFDFHQYQSDQIRFFQTTSDQYFLQHAGKQKFDIIFIDGLHTFEQTFRDFCNSILHAHDRTVWLIDDTLPNDVYSSLKTFRLANRAREAAGGEGRSWHGDVYKTVFAIHDFFPTFSYSTISSNGNPQTLLWRQPRENFQPYLNDLEAISRLDYFALQENISVLNLLNEEEALALAVKNSFSDK